MSETAELTKTKWIIDPAHSEIGFKVRHLMITNVKGTFNEYDASIYTTGDDFMSAEVDFWLNPASVNTGDASRDAHLRSADFFDAETHKQIHFTTDFAIDKVDNDGSYEVWGDLTVKGIKKQVKLSVEFGGIQKDPWGNEKAGMTINAKINRTDFGLNWNAALEAGGVLVSEDVRISCEIQLKKAS